MNQIILNSLKDAQEALNQFISSDLHIQSVADVAELMTLILNQGGTIFSCGNGGSMCDAMHFAEELSGKYRAPRKALAAMAISDPAHLSCAANDFGYDQVFARFVEAHGKQNDCLLVISTSGNSPNCIEACKIAQEKGMKVVGLLGKPNSKLEGMVDLKIVAKAGDFSDRIQELHIKILHIIIEIIERKIFPGLYES